jgi:hypothetical protein
MAASEAVATISIYEIPIPFSRLLIRTVPHRGRH